MTAAAVSAKAMCTLLVGAMQSNCWASWTVLLHHIVLQGAEFPTAALLDFGPAPLPLGTPSSSVLHGPHVLPFSVAITEFLFPLLQIRINTPQIATGQEV